VMINLIESEVENNYVFNNILFSNNNNLIRNRNSATEFNLIKDIVERNTTSVEEDINLSVAVPLYLGLMGTMIGIVIGLFSMSGLGAANNASLTNSMLEGGISSLIGGVKIAMIASFTGLMLTIISSGWIFKKSRSILENRKNDFYTFIQIELLPVINQDLSSTLDSFQRNLSAFNDTFTGNITQLSVIFDSSIQSIIAQKEFLKSLDMVKFSKIAEHNVAVLKQLEIAVKEFEKFNAYLNNINNFIINTDKIVERTNDLVTRTTNFGDIASDISKRLHQDEELIKFLSAHFFKLDEHKVFTSNAVADVGFAISASFKDLQGHIQNSSKAVLDFSVKEADLLKKTLEESKTNLSNLEHLATLNTDVSQLKANSELHWKFMYGELSKLDKQIDRLVSVIAGSDRHHGIRKRIINMFKPGGRQKSRIYIPPEHRQLNDLKQAVKVNTDREPYSSEKEQFKDDKINDQTEVNEITGQNAARPHEIFFLCGPDPDGSFNDNYAFPFYKEGESLYKFTKIENNQAEFQICDRETSVRLALMTPDRIIDPACESLNNFHHDTKRIITDSPGLAILIGNSWKIIQKAKIHYILL